MFVPMVVFAQTKGGTNWGLTIISFFQVFLFIGFLAGVGGAGWAFYQIKKDQADLLRGARHRRVLLICAIVSGACLSLFLIFSLAHWILARAPRAIMGTSTVPIEQRTALLADFSDFKKVIGTTPENNQRNVARNIKISIQFSESILPSSVADAAGQLLSDSISIQRDDAGGKPSVGGRAIFSSGNTVVTIEPSVPLGDANTAAWYTVALSKKVARQNGSPLFSSTSGYSWRFEVNGFLDTTPPFVESVLPPLAGEKFPPNSLVLLTFSKPIDPATVSADTIVVSNPDTGKPIPHSVTIGNNFRSAVLSGSEPCGTNGCGDPMLCFSKSSRIQITVKSARLSKEKSPDAPNRADFPYTGIVDTAGNSLDGGGEGGTLHNGKSEGPPADDYIARFETGTELDRKEPSLYSINPGRDKTKISTAMPLEAQFSKLMDATTINPSTVRLTPQIKMSFAVSHDVPNRRSRLTIAHDPLNPSTAYTPDVSSDVRDLSQNCFSKCLGPQ